MRKSAAKFFTEFETEHDIAHQDLEAIQNSIYFLGAALDSFASSNYGAIFDQNLLQCILKQFRDIFNAQQVETDKSINSLQDACDTLLDMARNFSIRHNLVCRRGKFTGCDAELNQLRCELSEFFRALNKAGRQAESDLRGIENASRSLGRIEKQFNSKYQLTCNQDDPESTPEPQRACQCNKGNIQNLQTDMRRIFYPEFRHTYQVARVKVDSVSGICDNLIAAIGAWKTKLA